MVRAIRPRAACTSVVKSSQTASCAPKAMKARWCRSPSSGMRQEPEVELALEIAKKVVGREVSLDREIALTLVKVSLKRLNSRAAAQVHLSPDDFAFVDAHREKLDFHGSLEIIEDRSVSPGGCLVRTDTGDIDARIESQFDEISHGLIGV